MHYVHAPVYCLYSYKDVACWLTQIIRCKGGMHIMNRFWHHLRGYLKCRSHAVGSISMNTRIRSAQWAYWHRDEDLWLETGNMLKRLGAQWLSHLDQSWTSGVSCVIQVQDKLTKQCQPLCWLPLVTIVWLNLVSVVPCIIQARPSLIQLDGIVPAIVLAMSCVDSVNHA